MYKMASGALLSFLLTGSAVTAQDPAAPTTAAPPECGLPAVADTVELNPVVGSDLVTVPVAINGAPKQFLLDIGRTPDMISDDAANDLKLSRADLSSGMGGLSNLDLAVTVDVKSGVKSSVYRDRVQAKSFLIGTATVPDVTLPIANDRDLGKSKSYDGLFTGAIFSKFDLNLDFAGKKLTILTPTTCQNPVYWPHQAVAVVPMSLVDDKITVPVTIDGRQIDAVIDTSSDHTVMRRTVAERKFGLKADTPEMAPAGDLRDGEGQHIYQHIFPQIAFAGVVAGNVPVLIQANSMIHHLNRQAMTGSRFSSATEPPIPDLALGMDVLHQLHIYIAYDQNKIFMTPAS